MLYRISRKYDRELSLVVGDFLRELPPISFISGF